MQQAVYSHWSAPERARGAADPAGWPSARMMWATLALSVLLARRTFSQIHLTTDVDGYDTIVRRLGLPFDTFDLALDDLDADPRLWCAGKLEAYRLAARRGSFVHLDGDVLLTKPLPARSFDVPLIVQSVEPLTQHPYGAYYGQAYAALDASMQGVPAWVENRPAPFAAFNCGVMGGTSTQFLERYAETALRLIRSDAMRAALHRVPAPNLCVVAEQYLLAAMAHHEGVPFVTLLPTTAGAEAEREAERIGYTHLFGDAKQVPGLERSILLRLYALSPAIHANVLSLS